MKMVLIMGSLYKFSKNSWKRFLEKWAATGEMPQIDRFATHITQDVPNITDWTAEDAQEALSNVISSTLK